jgi:small nuclear ribonucleoprotein (snRNP)-like protein
VFLGRFYIFFISILSILALSVWPARADVIVLNNGNTITGTITGGGKGTLTISTDYSEPITLHTSAIKQITMEEPIKVRLKDGKMLKGKLSITDQGKPEITTGGGGTCCF